MIEVSKIFLQVFVLIFGLLLGWFIGDVVNYIKRR